VVAADRAREFGRLDETQFRKIVLVAAISATIITAVSATTNQVRRSLWACWDPRNTWSCVHWSIECECKANPREPCAIPQSEYRPRANPFLSGRGVITGERVDSARRFGCITAMGALRSPHEATCRSIASRFYEGACVCPEHIQKSTDARPRCIMHRRNRLVRPMALSDQRPFGA
jgi:hypothetical protein